MLKRDPVTSSIPVMIVTQVNEEWVKEVSGEFGAIEFVLKPVDDKLMNRVATLARSRASFTSHP
jgi:response regulator RpfG family c-di-GMP phosphodiesterase